MKNAQFSLACTLLCVAAGNFVLALIALIRANKEPRY